MAIDPIIEQHASEAAFLWMLRNGAAGDPHYDLPDLEGLDERVEAHVDGLRVSGDAGWKACAAGLEVEEPGELFVAAAVATDRGDIDGMARVLDVGGGAPELQEAIVDGLGWITFESVSRILPGLLDPGCPPPLHFLGIAACAAHRVDPGGALEAALFSEDARLRACALRAVGELGRSSLVRLAKPHLASADEDGRFWAAWSLALSGDEEAVPVLWEIARGAGPHARAASALALRSTDAQTACRWVRELMGVGVAGRIGVAGAGHAGDAELLPSLLQWMEVPELARLAGESFTMITGVDLAGEHLSGKAPEGFQAGPTDDADDEEVDMDPDANLPWPNVAAVKRWWSHNRGRFSPRQRLLLGKPPTDAWCRDLLRHGYQRQRAAAALELALASPGKPLFAVRAPAFRQRRLLA